MTFETELRAALERATPGPWSLTISNMTLVTAMEDGWPSGLAQMTGRDELAADNGTLIVFLRNRALGIAELVEAARPFVAFLGAIDEHPTGWAFGKDDDSVVYQLMFRGQSFELTVGMLRKLAAALAHLDTPTGGEA